MNAYISHICNDNYLPGVIALVKSLRHHKCKNDVIIMITKGVSENAKKELLKLNAIVKSVEEIHYQGNRIPENGHRTFSKSNSWMTFTKINIWKEIQYDKVLYIDADTVVLGNTDEIFNFKPNSAILDCSLCHRYYGINSGVLLIRPSMETYDNLVRAMNSDEYDLQMSDQTLINHYFLKHETISFLDEKWNRLQKKNSNIHGAYIYHWNGTKPWNDKNIVNFNVWNFYYNL